MTDALAIPFLHRARLREPSRPRMRINYLAPGKLNGPTSSRLLWVGSTPSDTQSLVFAAGVRAIRLRGTTARCEQRNAIVEENKIHIASRPSKSSSRIGSLRCCAVNSSFPAKSISTWRRTRLVIGSGWNWVNITLPAFAYFCIMIDGPWQEKLVPILSTTFWDIFRVPRSAPSSVPLVLATSLKATVNIACTTTPGTRRYRC